ncbi:MAG: hypothetical protein P1V35_17700, partial [Planctomycetota bacterium]|nr:hypothetical protein [Planctomycetota bacterium]
RLGRRLDKGGSLWWFEVEIRIRLSAGDNCEVIRLCNLALENPLIDSDRAVVHWLRAVAFERLEDEERLIADLYQVTKLSPGHAEASAKLHGALAIRIQRRQVARRLKEGLQATEVEPANPRAWLELARAQSAAEETHASKKSYVKARDLDESLLTLSDWATLAQACIWGGDYDLAEICLEKTKAMGTELPELAKLLERERNSSEDFSGGMGEYPYVDEYGEEDAGEPAPPAAPPKTLTAEEWQQTLDRWASEMAKVREAHSPLSETFYPLQEQAFEWANRLDAIQTRAEFEAFVPPLQEHLSAHTEWRESQDKNEARYNRLSEEINTWFAWSSELERAGHAHEWIGPTKEITESLWELENPARVCKSEDLPGQMEATRLQFDRLDAFAKGSAELIREHSGLTNEEALSKSSELMSIGEPTPELFAILGLANYRLGQIEQALVPLHQSLAFPGAHGLEAEVRDALAQLQQRGQALIPTAAMLRESGDLQAANALAGRAADLACLDAQSHAEEARCLEISTIRLHALRCARLASNMEPESRAMGIAHMQLALRDRELSEAREVADRLVASNPRDPELLLKRAPILAMCGEREKAHQDLRFYNVLHNKSGRASLGHAFNERLQRTGFRLYRIGNDTRTWADKEAYDFAEKLFWFPGGDPKSDEAKAHIANVHSIMAGRAGIVILKEEPEGLTAQQKLEWPSIAFYLRGEILHAQGDQERAGWQFEKALKDAHLPIEVAYMIHKRTGLPIGLRSFQRHHPLRVPQVYKDAQFAIKIAKPGQTVLLSGSSHSTNMDLKRSIRIQGVGSTETRVYYSFSSNDSSNLWSPQPSKKSNSSISHGWVELAHLGLEVQTYTDGLEPEKASQFAHHLEAGGLLVEDCRFRGKTRFQIHPGARSLFLDCDFDQEIDSFL